MCVCCVQKVNLSPRSSIEDIFNDGIHANHRYPYPPFGRHQNQIPYFITSPPQQAFSKPHSPADVSDDDDDDDDVISLSTIPEVPSVMAGTLSPSEFMELGTTVGRRYRLRPAEPDDKPSQPNNAETADRELSNNNNASEEARDHVTAAGEDEQSRDGEKLVAARRRRLTLVLMAVIIVAFVLLVAIIVAVVVVLGTRRYPTEDGQAELLRPIVTCRVCKCPQFV